MLRGLREFRGRQNIRTILKLLFGLGRFDQAKEISPFQLIITAIGLLLAFFSSIAILGLIISSLV